MNPKDVVAIATTLAISNRLLFIISSARHTAGPSGLTTTAPSLPCAGSAEQTLSFCAQRSSEKGCSGLSSSGRGALRFLQPHAPEIAHTARVTGCPSVPSHPISREFIGDSDESPALMSSALRPALPLLHAGQ